MSKLDDLIKAAKDELVEPTKATQEVFVGGEVVAFEFTKLDAMVWRDLVAGFPARDGVARDLRLGYNYDLAPSGYPVSHLSMVDGDERVEVSSEQWAAVHGVLESPDLFNVSTLLWGLHEWEPSQRAVEAKKALARKKKK